MTGKSLACMIDANICATAILLTKVLSGDELRELVDVIEERLIDQGFDKQTISDAISYYYDLLPRCEGE